MRLMKYLVFIVVSAIGIFCGACASPHPTSGTIATEITRDVAEGTWALTDGENCLFDVNLLNDGVAISNWCKGTDGAKGEHGTWKIEDGVLVMNWTDGWLDVIQLGHIGFEKYSYAPRVNRQGPPSSFGQAVKVLNYSTQWAGVWKTRSADPAYNNQSFYICLQSNGAAMKSIDAINTGWWQKQQDGIAIYFSDGWYMLLTRDGDKKLGARRVANRRANGHLPNSAGARVMRMTSIQFRALQIVLACTALFICACQSQPSLWQGDKSPTQYQTQQMDRGGQPVTYYDLDDGDNEDPNVDNASYPEMSQPWWNSPGYIGG